MYSCLILSLLVIAIMQLSIALNVTHSMWMIHGRTATSHTVYTLLFRYVGNHIKKKNVSSERVAWHFYRSVYFLSHLSIGDYQLSQINLVINYTNLLSVNLYFFVFNVLLYKATNIVVLDFDRIKRNWIIWSKTKLENLKLSVMVESMMAYFLNQLTSQEEVFEHWKINYFVLFNSGKLSFFLCHCYHHSFLFMDVMNEIHYLEQKLCPRQNREFHSLRHTVFTEVWGIFVHH